VLAILILVGVFGYVISQVGSQTNNVSETQFRKLAKKFEEHALNAHWKWRAQKPTSIIMFIHYDKNGNEIDRAPVTMNHLGWPAGKNTAEGCQKIWSALLAIPLSVDGYKVRADFVSEGDDEEDQIWCQYSLSSGPYFNYYPRKGMVTN
jgi:hypothetical protein